MNTYEAKQEARRERYEELADKAREESAARYQASNAATAGIPLGQPILVGHHSEGTHRAAIRRTHSNMDKSVEAQRKAEYYDQKAASVGKGGISSDDPEAVVKLREKLAKLEEHQVYMKKVNRAHKAHVNGSKNAPKLLAEFTPEEQETIKTYTPEYSWVPHPFAPYQLKNNNANIRSTKKRIASLANRITETTEKTVKGVRVVKNAEENRIQLFFDGKPSEEIRTTLKRHGFRWSRYFMAWQRQLNTNGLYAARAVLRTL